ncbi:MAG: class D sortase [Oscillospiraceae bacterium]|nr:class D sortase [Oscillospiraceae bacterium]
MRKAEAIQQFRDYMIRLMGLLVAPLIFALIISGIAFTVINTFAGDLVGYGSLLLMDPVAPDHDVSDFLAPAEPGKGTADTIDIKDITFPKYEQVYGEISIPSVNIQYPFVYGDTEKALKKGVGQFIGSTIVGYGGTTMACAHVNRQFKNLHKTKVGDTVEIRTSYGVYTYEVKYVGVHSASDDSIYDLAREDENLVLYTCYYQRTALGSVKKRFFVCADYVSGPMIVDWGNMA